MADPRQHGTTNQTDHNPSQLQQPALQRIHLDWLTHQRSPVSFPHHSNAAKTHPTSQSPSSTHCAYSPSAIASPVSHSHQNTEPAPPPPSPRHSPPHTAAPPARIHHPVHAFPQSLDLFEDTDRPSPILPQHPAAQAKPPNPLGHRPAPDRHQNPDQQITPSPS